MNSVMILTPEHNGNTRMCRSSTNIVYLTTRTKNLSNNIEHNDLQKPYQQLHQRHVFHALSSLRMIHELEPGWRV